MAEESVEQPVAVCLHLRTKKMYYQEGYDVPDLTTDAHPYFWCMETMNNVGPDDGLVTMRHCRPGRSCFEGVD